MSILPEENELEFHEIYEPAFEEKKVRLTIARLDKLHPVVSGNKLFKLHYFLEDAAASPHKKILTFGGAYSNHLLATAYAARALGLQAIGIVRGEKPAIESSTLQGCRHYGMELKFISRSEYQDIHEPYFTKQIQHDLGDIIIIPEGGYHPLGAKGASLIMERMHIMEPSHICVPVGTSTTLAGLLTGAKKEQQITGFPVLKGMNDIDERVSWLLGNEQHGNLKLVGEYHFGGYAKTTSELISFMNSFYKNHLVPLDFVYTAKMMFGTIQKIHLNFFPEGSNIICLHTGGLQGNNSLEKGLLVY